MISKLQEFVDNIKKVLDQSATSSIAAPSPVETAPPPPRTTIPDVTTVEDNTKIEAGPTRKGAMAAALAMTLQRLNNVQAINEGGQREVAIRQADREAAAEAHKRDMATQFENEKNLLNFKENLPSNVDARATNKAYREAMTRNANASADFKQARISGSLPSMAKGGKNNSAPAALPKFESEEELNAQIKNASGKQLADLIKKKNAIYGKGSALSPEWADSKTDPRYQEKYLLDKKTGKIVGTTGLYREKITNPVMQQVSNAINQSNEQSAPPNISAQPPGNPTGAPASAQPLRKPKTKEEYQQMRQIMTKEQIEALPE